MVENLTTKAIMRAILSKNYFLVKYLWKNKKLCIFWTRRWKYAIIEPWKILKLGLRHDLPLPNSEMSLGYQIWGGGGGNQQCGRHNLPPLVGVGLSELPFSVWASPLSPPPNDITEIGSVLSHLMWKEIEWNLENSKVCCFLCFFEKQSLWILPVVELLTYTLPLFYKKWFF